MQVVEAASAVGHMLHGKSLENVASGIDCHTVKQPLGVVAGICPFNFPAMVSLLSDVWHCVSDTNMVPRVTTGWLDAGPVVDVSDCHCMWEQLHLEAK